MRSKTVSSRTKMTKTYRKDKIRMREPTSFNHPQIKMELTLQKIKSNLEMI